jgi:hypothetical protein
MAKRSLNISWIRFHIREALGELRGLEALLEYLETGARSEWLNESDVHLLCKGERPSDSSIEGHLCASLAHAYHHMNFGWNSRRCDNTLCADDQFSKNENFPRPSEAGWDFYRYWSKKCQKCLAGGKRRKETKHLSSDKSSAKRGKKIAE